MWKPPDHECGASALRGVTAAVVILRLYSDDDVNFQQWIHNPILKNSAAFVGGVA